jgi:hypothetical protein
MILYILWLEKEIIGGDEGRFVHFNWGPGNERVPVTFRIRDYINRTLFYPKGLRPDKNETWENKALELSAVEIWRKAKDRWPASVSFNLSPKNGVKAENDGWWACELKEMTGCRKSGLESGGDRNQP